MLSVVKYFLLGVVFLFWTGVILSSGSLTDNNDAESCGLGDVSVSQSANPDALESLLSREFFFERKAVRIAKADWQRLVNVLPARTDETENRALGILGNPHFENIGPYIFNSTKKPVKDFGLEEAMLCFGWYEELDGKIK